MAKNCKVTISDQLYKDLKKYGEQFCVGMATQVRDKLTISAAVAIESFYQDYKPIYYARHYYNFRDNSFKKFYENKHGHIVRGGVELSPENMDSIYQDPKEEVFDMVYAGYHGVASGFNAPYTFTPVPIMRSSPLEIIEEASDSIINHIDMYSIWGYYRASKETYSTLTIRG